ncbi:heat shock protein 70 family, partial [Limtongia smithiae]|uniref:heat shock protein 70 family n=1 Tax=Limtongia smithiae TaxID=1125753 RepID=UPI0034CF386F
MIFPRSFLAVCIAVLAAFPRLSVASILGIDFGQATTKAALVSPGIPFEIVLTRDSKRKDVSAIGFKKDERLYGNSATTFAARSPENVFSGMKSLLGLSILSPEAEVYMEQHPGVTLAPSGNRSTVSFKAIDTTFAIEELLGMSFAHVKSLAESMLPKDSAVTTIRDVAITVPPFFTSLQRKALIDAAEIGGLRVVALVSDGVATAINYASTRTFTSEKQYHMILDIGAGSTSATLVSFQEGPVGNSIAGKTALNITVESVGYDSSLGGDLLDQRIYEILLARFTTNHGTGIESNARALVRLHKEAERAKTILSANQEVRVSVESLYDDIDLRTVVTRAEFEEAIADVLPRLHQPIETALSKAKLDILEVSSVILMGGSTRVPIFQNVLVKEILNGDASKVSKGINADEAAVLGAAFRGVTVSRQFKTTKEINVIE